MIIKILGAGCPRCIRLEENAKEAVKALNINDVSLEHVTDIDKIVSYGVMSTPAIVIDDVVKAYGRVVPTDEIKSWLK